MDLSLELDFFTYCSCSQIFLKECIGTQTHHLIGHVPGFLKFHGFGVVERLTFTKGVRSE